MLPGCMGNGSPPLAAAAAVLPLLSVSCCLAASEEKKALPSSTAKELQAVGDGKAPESVARRRAGDDNCLLAFAAVSQPSVCPGCRSGSQFFQVRLANGLWQVVNENLFQEGLAIEAG